MTTTINAVAGTGVVTTSDGSGIVKLQSAGVTTNALAWANFDPSAGSISTRATYNVSSIVYNSTGNYTINLTNATDGKYVAIPAGTTTAGTADYPVFQITAATASAFTIVQGLRISGATANSVWVTVAVFGN